MKDLVIATKFTALLFEISSGEEHLIKLMYELKDVVKDIKTHKNLYEALISPIISSKEKAAVIKGLYQKTLDPTLVKFLCFLAYRKHFNLIKKIGFYFEKKVLAFTNEELVTIVVPEPVSKEFHETVKKHFQKILKEHVIIAEKIDPSILGGIKIFFKNYMLDNTLKTKIQHLKKSLLQKEIV